MEEDTDSNAKFGFKDAGSRIKEGEVAVLAGAGISQESGIPTFRGEGGLWQRYDPFLYARMPQAVYTFLESPQKISSFVTEFYQTLLPAVPNTAHRAVADLEKRGLIKGIITQNIDNLHQEAGSKRVFEIHGNAYEVVCRRCGYKERKQKSQIEKFVERLKALTRPIRIKGEFLRFLGRCKKCSMHLRPNIVFFGERLPYEQIVESRRLLESCRTLLIIGASGGVFPVASFPYEAKRNGAFIIEANPEISFPDIADIPLEGKAVQIFKRLKNYI